MRQAASQFQQRAAIQAALHHGKAGTRGLARVDAGAARKLRGHVIDEGGKVAFACRCVRWMPALIVHPRRSIGSCAPR